MSQIYDTVVVGAGMAGLVAARDLSTRGRSVLLVEGRDRIGGRTFTDTALGGQLDLGGGYVHWTQPNVWTEMERHGLEQINPPLESKTVYQLADGKVHTTEQVRTFDLVGKLFADARERFPLPINVRAVENGDINDQTLEQRIDSLQLSKHDSDLVRGALGGLVHNYAMHGSTQLLFAVASNFGSYAAELETASSWCITGGVKKLSDAIQAESNAELQLSTAITKVTDSGSGVTLLTSNCTEIQAKTAILAVPINTMRRITITPSLPPSVSKMLADGNPVRGSKLWVIVRGHVEPFSALAPAGQHPLNAVRVEKYWGDNTMILCMISDSDSIKHDDHDAVQKALRLFVPDLEVVDTAWYDWNEDEFSQGGWMMHRPRHFLEGAVKIREGHGRISFAGADIAAMAPCTIDGAMNSGAAAAVQVEQFLNGPRHDLDPNPQVKTWSRTIRAPSSNL
ncbi:Putative Amine oxidase [Penicillium brasilianum]|uniref:monoamine oxidase n=1 Tax=Penicillium brasilianum TaxID=104259 RepID=A0A0F7TWD4_PENBI|nr:Putative Amine oxidase [Penicillium brasilianum]